MECERLFRNLQNPYFIRDDPALTQSLGWVDAWISAPSEYAVEAVSTEDVAAAVNFAREHRVRIVVKGGGHSYKGASCAPDSLLIWTRHMNDIVMHDAFVPRGSMAKPVPAVSIGAGAIWAEAYETVTTRGGRYVQGGGCTTVGVAGLVQGGGFGSFSKRYGLAAAALLEAEIVTADGHVRIANENTHPDLYWALKGGGGGTMGVVTRMTLRTRELPTHFGGVFLTIRAASEAAFRRLVERIMTFYRESLFNPGWGEQIRFHPDLRVEVSMVFQGFDSDTARETWRPFLDWLARSPTEFVLAQEPVFLGVPARHLWDPAVLLKEAPTAIVIDNRPGAPRAHFVWEGDAEQAGQWLHGYHSAWLPAALLRPGRIPALVETLISAARVWSVSLHFNKGLAGAPPEEIEAARATAIHPAVLDAFALAIIAGTGPRAYPGLSGREPDVLEARRRADRMRAAMDALRSVIEMRATYVSESDYFDTDWRESYWGPHYNRLRAVKRKYDPDGMFVVHHGIGSEDWSADGFTRNPARKAG